MFPSSDRKTEGVTTDATGTANGAAIPNNPCATRHFRDKDAPSSAEVPFLDGQSSSELGKILVKGSALTPSMSQRWNTVKKPTKRCPSSSCNED